MAHAGVCAGRSVRALVLAGSEPAINNLQHYSCASYRLTHSSGRGLATRGRRYIIDSCVKHLYKPTASSIPANDFAVATEYVVSVGFIADLVTRCQADAEAAAGAGARRGSKAPAPDSAASTAVAALAPIAVPEPAARAASTGSADASDALSNEDGYVVIGSPIPTSELAAAAPAVVAAVHVTSQAVPPSTAAPPVSALTPAQRSDVISSVSKAKSDAWLKRQLCNWTAGRRDSNSQDT